MVTETITWRLYEKSGSIYGYPNSEYSYWRLESQHLAISPGPSPENPDKNMISWLKMFFIRADYLPETTTDKWY